MLSINPGRLARLSVLQRDINWKSGCAPAQVPFNYSTLVYPSLNSVLLLSPYCERLWGWLPWEAASMIRSSPHTRRSLRYAMSLTGSTETILCSSFFKCGLVLKRGYLTKLEGHLEKVSGHVKSKISSKANMSWTWGVRSHTVLHGLPAASAREHTSHCGQSTRSHTMQGQHVLPEKPQLPLKVLKIVNCHNLLHILNFLLLHKHNGLFTENRALLFSYRPSSVCKYVFGS